MVGRDTVNSVARFCFGNMNLTAGISLLPVMIGLFGFPEIVDAFNPEKRELIRAEKFHAKEGFKVIWRNKLNIVRSALLGVCMGAIPGVGEDTGGWIAYWSEKKVSKTPELWGKGCIDGVVSSEAGNNAAVGGAIIPVLSLAIPGSAPAAVLLARVLDARLPSRPADDAGNPRISVLYGHLHGVLLDRHVAHRVEHVARDRPHPTDRQPHPDADHLHLLRHRRVRREQPHFRHLPDVLLRSAGRGHALHEVPVRAVFARHYPWQHGR